MIERSFPLRPSDYLSHSDLLEALLAIERRYDRISLDVKKRTAVFDLDNTLLTGDIGNAVLAYLMIEGFPLQLKWSKYEQLEAVNPAAAYAEAAKALAGLSVDFIVRTTQSLLQCGSGSLFCEGTEIPIPKPNPVMREFVKILRGLDYTVYVVSASNDLSARVAGSLLFGLPTRNIAGIRSHTVNGRLTRRLLYPLPVGAGKVAQYRAMAGDIHPTVVASDSHLDIPMLQMCDPYGIAILVGDNEQLISSASVELPLTVTIRRVPGTPQPLQFEKQQLVA